MTPEEVAAVLAERARDLLSLANRDQIYQPSRTTALLANDVLALASLVSEQAAAVARVAGVVDQYAVTDDETPTDWEGKPLPVVEYTEPEDVWRLFRDLRAALAGEQP